MPIDTAFIPFNPAYVSFIREVLTIAEQGTKTIPYSKVEVMADGPGNKNQITLSIGFTEFGGNLKRVVQRYCDKGGVLASRFATYLPIIGGSALATDTTFKQLLRDAGKEKVMEQVQEDSFEEFYLSPAFRFCKTNNLSLPLSYLVVCDSYLHSGSVPDFLRKKFPATLPAKTLEGEKQWVSEYMNVRHDWLTSHSNKLLRNTIYRTSYYKTLIKDEDWQLERAHLTAMNGVKPNKVVLA